MTADHPQESPKRRHRERLPVFIVKNAEAVDHLIRLGVVRATCVPDPSQLNSHFGGDDVILIPANTDDGFAYINEVGAALIGQAKSIRVLMLPGLPPGGDPTGWFKRGGTADQLREAIEQTTDWVPPPLNVDAEAKARAEAGEQQLIDELARLGGLEYDRRRKQAAADLSVNALEAITEAAKVLWQAASKWIAVRRKGVR